MSADARAYLGGHIIPLIAEKYPRVAGEMCVVVEGSHALGLADGLSDLDAIIYLEDDLWHEEGGQVQLLLWREARPFRADAARYCDFPGHPEAWAACGHPEVCVHPVSWLLDGQARTVLDGGAVPWEEISPEALFKLHSETLALRDPRGLMAGLCKATRPEHLPDWLWRKRLLLKLADIKGGPGELGLAVERGEPVEASILLGSLLADLLRAGFVTARAYHPYPKRLRWAFEKLPFAESTLPLIDAIASSPGWQERVHAVQALVACYTDVILDTGALAPEVLEHLYPARDHEAWSNPDWLQQIRAEERRAQDAGCEAGDRWLWSLWDWD